MKNILIIGCGRMAFSIAQYLEKNGKNVLGFTDPKPPAPHVSGFHKKYLGPDHLIETYPPDTLRLVLALSDTHYRKKENIFKKLKEKGYQFERVIFPNVYFDDSVRIGEGVILFPNVNINSYSVIEDVTVVNSSCSIDHDCRVMENCYLGPSVTLAGSVTVEENVLIGTGASVLPLVGIGKNSIIGGGALLTKTIPPGEIWHGIPAEKIRQI